MYSTCAFCDAGLARNERIEHFPVGRRLAYDAAKGRLWVICRACAQWNLAPVEERWEAIEECERLYRGLRTRVATDQVGMARLYDGLGPLDLVRIGAPLRPEMAAWRYGAQLTDRRRRSLVQFAGASTLGLGAALAATGLVALGVPAIAGGAVLGALSWSMGRTTFRKSRPLVLTADDGQTLGMGREEIFRVGLRDAPDPGSFRLVVDVIRTVTQSVGRLEVPVNHGADYRHLTFTGAEAWRGARVLLPRINGIGATAAAVREAVEGIDRAGSPDAYVGQALKEIRRRGLLYSPIGAFPREIRLALEMVMHEEVERRAMQGELDLLAEAWRRAESTAAIADSL